MRVATQKFTREKSLILLSYTTIYIVWGSTYFFIKMAVQSIHPLAVVGIRFFIGGIAFLLIAILTKRLNPFPTLKQIGASILLGSLLLLGGNGLISYAERKVDSYLVALIIASTPLVVAIFDRILLKKRITATRIVGIILGEIGVALLVYNGKSLTTSLNIEIAMVILAILLWAIATTLGHKFNVYPDNLVNSGIQMLFAGSIALILACALGELNEASLRTITAHSLFGLVYLAIVGSLAFSAYTYLLSHEPASRIVSYSLVNPVIAVILGFFLGNETPVRYFAIGLPLILGGLVALLYGETLLKKLNPKT